MTLMDQNGTVHPDAYDTATPARIAHIERCEDCRVRLGVDPFDSVLAAYEGGKRTNVTQEPYEIAMDDAPETLAFWDGYYGKPLRSQS